jgi:hypothetical protein
VSGSIVSCSACFLVVGSVGDGMDLLAHWVCENCDSVDPPIFKGDERACGICADEGENGLLVELVPRSQLRGAVGENERLREALHGLLDHPRSGTARLKALIALGNGDGAKAIADRFGGQ